MKQRLLSLLLVICLLLSLASCAFLDLPGLDESSSINVNSGLEVPEGSSFVIHFIDVGQADAALVLCDGMSMLIDGGNAEDSNLIYNYLRKQGITHLNYIVSTHAHEDHVGGLSGALTAATVGKVYSPVTSYSTKAFKNFANKVEAQEILGKRTFARPMHKRENGVYALVRFELDPAKVTELVNRYRLVEEVFRVQILAVDDRREAKLAQERAVRAEKQAKRETAAAAVLAEKTAAEEPVEA